VNGCGTAGVACFTCGAPLADGCNGSACTCAGNAQCASGQTCCGGGGCANLSSDPKNCGACGHSCLGGACSSGICQPLVIGGSVSAYSGLKSLYGLTAFGANVIGTDWYQTNYGILYRVPNNGVGATPAYIAGIPTDSDGSGVSIVNDGVNLFFAAFRGAGGANTSRIYIANPDGTGVRNINSMTTNIGSLTVDGSYLYWTYIYSSGLTMANKAGAILGPVTTSDANTAMLPVDGVIYYSNGGVVQRGTPTPNGLGSITPVGTGGGKANVIRGDASYVYWLDAAAHKIWRVAKSGGTPADVTPTGGLPVPYGSSAMIVDANSNWTFYFNYNLGSAGIIYRFAKDGSGAPQKIADLPDGLGSITEDAQAIYWGSYGKDPPAGVAGPIAPFSAVYKLAK
jgi:hypothetical protein